MCARKTATLCIAFLPFALTQLVLSQSRPDDPMKRFKQWIEEEVAYIITDPELQVFNALTAAEEKEHFIEQFWARRDPTSSTAENEFKEEHYRRIQYANERFAAGRPGWRTDRGRIYIKYGEP